MLQVPRQSLSHLQSYTTILKGRMEIFASPLQPVLESARLKEYPKGQIIHYQGDDLLEVFVIKSGVVKIYDIDEQGNEKVLHIAKAPAVIPFSFFSGGALPPNWFYSALTDCELFVMPTEVLQTAVDNDSALGVALMNAFSRDVHELLVRLSSLGKTKALDKLAATLRFLLVLHATERRNGWARVNFPVNHQLLADIAGITRERTAMVMKELQDKKAIRNPRLNVLEIHRVRLRDASMSQN